MILCKWEDLPDNMRVEEVRPYYDILAKKKVFATNKNFYMVYFLEESKVCEQLINSELSIGRP